MQCSLQCDRCVSHPHCITACVSCRSTCMLAVCASTCGQGTYVAADVLHAGCVCWHHYVHVSASLCIAAWCVSGASASAAHNCRADPSKNLPIPPLWLLHGVFSVQLQATDGLHADYLIRHTQQRDTASVQPWDVQHSGCVAPCAWQSQLVGSAGTSWVHVGCHGCRR